MIYNLDDLVLVLDKPFSMGQDNSNNFTGKIGKVIELDEYCRYNLLYRLEFPDYDTEWYPENQLELVFSV